MAEKIFDRETLLDLTVNAIPLGMLLFFTVLFLAFRPFGSAPVAVALQFSIVLLMFAALLALTYYAGMAVSLAETEMESEAAPGQGPGGDPAVASTDVEDAERALKETGGETTPETPEH